MTVVDASALFKLIAEEEHSDRIRKNLLAKTSVGDPIEAPDIVVPEVLNALWKSYVLKRDMNQSNFESAVKQLDAIMEQLDLISGKELKDIALRVSVEKRIPIYDSMYIAAGIQTGSPLLSCDRELVRKASELGVRIEPL